MLVTSATSHILSNVAKRTYIAARVPPELAADLEELAHREERTLSQELRLAVREHVHERRDPTDATTTNTRKPDND